MVEMKVNGMPFHKASSVCVQDRQGKGEGRKVGGRVEPSKFGPQPKAVTLSANNINTGAIYIE